MNNARQRGMTIRDLLIVVVTLAVLLAIAVPAIHTLKRRLRFASNADQMGGIFQGMVTFSQSNRGPTGDGYYPGLNGSGQLVDAVTFTGVDGTFLSDGTRGDDPSVRYCVMLNASYFTPEYMIRPAEKGNGKSEVWPIGEVDDVDDSVSSDNFSYAMLRIDDPLSGRRGEWQATQNASAVVLSDRNVGSGSAVGQAESDLAEAGSGRWEGQVQFNDGSSLFLSPYDGDYDSPVLTNTRFGVGPVMDADNLFSDDEENTGSNAAMVYQDATTLVNQK